MVPGLDPKFRELPILRDAYEAAQSEQKLDKLRERLEKLQKEVADKAASAGAEADETIAAKRLADRTKKAYALAIPAVADSAKREALREQATTLQREQEQTVSGVQIFQEVGGLAGRFALAWLALRIVSRRKLLWTFQIPGLLIVPLVYFFPAAGNLSENNLEVLSYGMFFVGFFTVAQFSFWGNYLPRVYPMYLRGTGESFAANVGGRMIGTSANFLTTRIAVLLLALMPTLARPSGIAYAAAGVALFVYAAGTCLTFLLPEPRHGEAED
jgi:hypothetical protein